MPDPPWRRIFTARSTRLDRRWRARPEDFDLGSGAVPVLELVSAVITALCHRPLGPGDLTAALLDRRGAWITTAGLAGFAPGLDGLAATLSTDYEIIAAGRSRAAAETTTPTPRPRLSAGQLLPLFRSVQCTQKHCQARSPTLLANRPKMCAGSHTVRADGALKR